MTLFGRTSRASRVTRTLAAAGLALAATHAAPVAAQDRTAQFEVVEQMQASRGTRAGAVLKHAAGNVGTELVGIARIPVDFKKETAWALAGVGALMLVDRPVTEFYQDEIEPIFGDFALPEHPLSEKASDLGLANEDVWLLTGVGGLYGYGLVADDTRAQQAAVLSAKAIAYSYLTSQIVLKTAFGRNRPYSDLSSRGANETDGTFTTDPFDFGNQSGIKLKPDAKGTAMPSYHFTQYFAVAHVVSRSYDNSWVPYGLAGLLSASNIRGHRHWVSDMAAGTLLGIGIGEVLWRSNQDFAEGDFSITPQVGRDTFGLTFETSF